MTDDFERMWADLAPVGRSATSGGYFDVVTEGLPLVHTWSLSVEEQFYLVLPALLVLTLLVVRRRRGATSPLPAIAADLQTSFTELQWITNVYLLGLAVFLILGGKIGDRFGRRCTANEAEYVYASRTGNLVG